jgi:hypothetical protein
MRILAIALVALGGAAAAAAGGSRNVDLLRAFAPQLPKVKRVTSAPVLLPGRLPLGGSYRLYATGGASRSSWELTLAGAPRCGNANACFVASFAGTRGATLPWRRNATLRNGDPAAYKPITCGASCSPASFWFVHAGVLYSWQVKDLASTNARAAFVRLANDALVAGPR